MSVVENITLQTSRRDRTEPYSGYYLNDVPYHDPEITHTGPGTPMGEVMRRFWHPVCLSSQLGDLPLSLRILGEDLVAFRDKSGNVGVLHKHCSHRGTSLEYGIVSEHGIRCCYHGWLFDTDGTILETPGEPPDSKLKDSFRHGAYPVREYKGLVFAYFGPAEEEPEFPIYDTWEMPDTQMSAYSIEHPCNWLQVHENIIDPIHTAFLHSTMSAGIQITEAYASLPILEFQETDEGHGMLYICSRRMPNGLVWVRNNHALLPNHIHIAAINIHADKVAPFTRAGMDWWTVPNDDTSSTVFGWRHYSDEVDPHHDGIPEDNKVNYADHIGGQTQHNPPDLQQREPGDWEVLTSQRPIAVHALEHLGSTDTGVALLRQLLREAARGEISADPAPLKRASGLLHTYVQDTVLELPRYADDGDRDYIRQIGRRVTEIVTDVAEEPAAERRVRTRSRLSDLASAETAVRAAE